MTVYYLVSMCTIHSLFMYSQLPMQSYQVTVYPTVYAIWIAIHKLKSCHGSVSSCCIWQLNGTQAFHWPKMIWSHTVFFRLTMIKMHGMALDEGRKEGRKLANELECPFQLQISWGIHCYRYTPQVF